MRPAKIDLHIEELVLHGFASGDRHRIARAMGQELERLLDGQDLPAALAGGVELSHLDAGIFEITPGTRPEIIGARVARALYERLSQ